MSLESLSNAPIGIFDSGVGGVSVLRDIRRRLPHESVIYVADSGYCPYGPRPNHEIIARAEAITDFLIERGVKMIVVACNTATVAAVEWLRANYTLPFVGMEPAIKPAVQQTRTGVVGVLATVAALAGERVHRLLELHAKDVRVITQPCPGLAEQVEAGDLNGPETRRLVEEYTAPFRAANVDTVVIGCTHYPFLRPVLTEVLGPDVALIDTGAAVARRIEWLLSHDAMLNPGTEQGTLEWFTSGDHETVGAVIERLWQAPVDVQPLPPQASLSIAERGGG